MNREEANKTLKYWLECTCKFEYGYCNCGKEEDECWSQEELENAIKFILEDNENII